MRTKLTVLTVLLSSLWFFASGATFAAGSPSANSGYVTQAESMITSMVKGDFNAAEADFGDVMTQAAPPAKLQEVWNGIVKQEGEFQKIAGTRILTHESYTAVLVTTDFKNGALTFAVTFNTAGKIVGFHLAPAG